MSEVADLYVVLRSVGTKFEEGMARAGASAEVADSKIATMNRTIRTMSLAMVGGGLLVAGAAIKMSSEFDRLMEQIHTLAHVPQAALKSLSSGVLEVAGQVGFSPNSLAQALYHVESTFASTGITGKKALDILKISSKGAQIGGADLVDVTNALDAAVVSGIPGVKNINQAMGALLATVGAGDMTMQNLANALGTGILAVVKQYGVTLSDTGAALATFGDNNIRGTKAATDLRMAIMDLVKQSKHGQGVLKHIGLEQNQLGKDMQTGGLNKAILDLHAHLEKAGVTGVKVGALLTDAFTKRSSAPLAILLGELKQFESKYPELKKGANEFGDAWKRTSALISTRAKMAKANVETAFIGLGHALSPIASSILNMFNHAFEWAKTHKKTIEEIGKVVKVFLVGALIIAAGVLASMAIEAAIAAAPFVALALAIGFAVKAFMNFYNHNAAFRKFINDLVTTIKKDAVVALHWLMSAFKETKKVIGEVIGAVVGFYQDHKKAINKMVDDVVAIMKDIGKVFAEGFNAVKAIVQTVIKIVVDLWDRFGKHLWDHIVTAWNAIVQVVRGAFNVIKGIFEVITGILTGNWGKFWQGIKDIVSGVWNIISGVVKTAMNFISTIIGAGMAAISAVWDLIWHTIEHVAKNAWSIITAVFSAIVGVFKTIGRGIMSVWTGIETFLASIPGKVWGFFSRAGTWLLIAGKNIITGLWNGIVSVWNTVTNWFSNLGSTIWNFFSDAGTWLFDAGKAIFQGLWNGLKHVWNDMTGWLGDIGGWISDLKGPIDKDRQLLIPHGKAIMAGLHEGLINGFGNVKKSLGGMAGEMSGVMNVGLNGNVVGRLGGPTSRGSGAVGGNSGSSGNTYITVQGQLVDTNGFFKAMQTASQRHGARNPLSAGLAFTR